MVYQRTGNIRTCSKSYFATFCMVCILLGAIAPLETGCGLIYNAARQSDSRKTEPPRHRSSVLAPEQPLAKPPGYWKEKAEKAYADGDCKSAAEYYKKAGSLQNDPEAAVHKGDCLFQIGDLRGAQRAYKIGLGYRRLIVKGAGLGLARIGLATYRKSEERLSLFDLEKLQNLVEQEEAFSPGRPEVAACRKEIEELITKKKELKEEEEARRRQDNEARKRRLAEADARLESQVKSVGRLRCRPILFRVYPNVIGADGRIKAAVGVVISCTNKTRKKERIDASDVTLIDSSGGQHDLGIQGDYAQVLQGETEKDLAFIFQKFMYVSPHSKVYIGLFFNLETASLGDVFKLDIKSVQFDLSHTYHN